MAMTSNSAAARANAARETCRARMRRIVAEDDQKLCVDGCGRAHVIVRFVGNRTIRQCISCGTSYNPETADMTVEEILSMLDEEAA